MGAKRKICIWPWIHKLKTRDFDPASLSWESYLFYSSVYPGFSLSIELNIWAMRQFFCYHIAGKVVVVSLTRCYKFLYFVFFALGKGISGEYTFYSIQAPSNSIHFVSGKYPHILIYFYFYKQTPEPPQWGFFTNNELLKEV